MIKYTIMPSNLWRSWPAMTMTTKSRVESGAGHGDAFRSLKLGVMIPPYRA